MTALVWHQPGEKTYESGLDRGVFFHEGAQGHAWNGLVSVDQDVSGGEVNQYYFDGRKYLDFVYSEDFQATLTAFSVPPLFHECEGEIEIAAGLFATHQPRKTFAFSYRTGLGNDLEGDDYGYNLHLVWGATASPSSRSHTTRSDNVELATRQWTIDCVPPDNTTFKPTAHLKVNSLRVNPSILQEIEDAIYGTALTASYMPTQEQVVALFQVVE